MRQRRISSTVLKRLNVSTGSVPHSDDDDAVCVIGDSGVADAPAPRRLLFSSAPLLVCVIVAVGPAGSVCSLGSVGAAAAVAAVAVAAAPLSTMLGVDVARLAGAPAASLSLLVPFSDSAGAWCRAA